MLIVMAGLPGTGKSTLARELARRTRGHVLDKDVVREALFGPGAIDYSTQQDDLVVRLMLEAARYLLHQRPDMKVFVDGRVFSRRYQLEEVIAFARDVGTPWVVLECVCSDQAARERLQRDQQSGAHAASNRSFKLYQEVKSRLEPITREKTVIDTDQPLEQCVELALSAINA